MKKKFQEGDIFYYYTGDLLILENGHLSSFVTLIGKDGKEYVWSPFIAGSQIDMLIRGCLLIHLPF